MPVGASLGDPSGGLHKPQHEHDRQRGFQTHVFSDFDMLEEAALKLAASLIRKSGKVCSAPYIEAALVCNHRMNALGASARHDDGFAPFRSAWDPVGCRIPNPEIQDWRPHQKQLSTLRTKRRGGEFNGYVCYSTDAARRVMVISALPYFTATRAQDAERPWACPYPTLGRAIR